MSLLSWLDLARRASKQPVIADPFAATGMLPSTWSLRPRWRSRRGVTTRRGPDLFRFDVPRSQTMHEAPIAHRFSCTSGRPRICTSGAGGCSLRPRHLGRAARQGMVWLWPLLVICILDGSFPVSRC